MKTIVLDFETFYSSKLKYSLKNLSIVEYIHHPEFLVQGCAIKIDSDPTRWFSGEQLDSILKTTNWDDARVVAHNVKFDGAILAWKYGISPAQWVDTKAMAKAVIGSQAPSSSLRDVAKYLGLTEKGELRTNGKKHLTKEEEAEVAEYCKNDVDLCHDIFHALMKHMPGSQWSLIDWTVRAFLEPKLYVNKDKCQAVHDASVVNKDFLLSQVGVDVKVLSSNQQFAKLLEAEGFKVPMKTNKAGGRIPALSVQDKEFLEMGKSSNGRLRDLCKARKAVKQTLEETRAQKLANVADISKYCFDVIFSGAQQTHRFSGGSGCAGNPQNFGRGSQLRAALEAGEGEVLVVADFSNIELRVLAFLSQDQHLMEAIKKGEDVYCQFASKIYGRPITKADKKERNLGKAAVLGLGYNMGAEKFIQTVYQQSGELLPYTFAKQVVELYRNTYTGVPQFWKTCDKVLEMLEASDGQRFPGVPFLRIQKHEIILPSGLDIKYPNLKYRTKLHFKRWKKEWTYDRYKSQKGSRDEVKIYGGMVTENLCQGIAGEICKEAIQRLIDYGYPPLGMVHDELLVVCKEDEVEKVKYLVTAAMTQPVPWWGELPLQVEVGTGKNWLEAK